MDGMTAQLLSEAYKDSPEYYVQCPRCGIVYINDTHQAGPLLSPCCEGIALIRIKYDPTKRIRRNHE